MLRARLDPGMEKEDGGSAGGEPWPRRGRGRSAHRLLYVPINPQNNPTKYYYPHFTHEALLRPRAGK